MSVLGSKPRCDPVLVLEIISDIIDALRSKSEVEVYRYFGILKRYLKGKKCPKEIIERSIRLLESIRGELKHNKLFILSDILDYLRGISREAKSVRKKAVKRKKRTKKAHKR